MKIIKTLIAIFFLLLIAHTSAEYTNYSRLAHPFWNIMLIFLYMLIIVFYLESMKFGYIILLLITYPLLAPAFAMEVLMFNEKEKKNIDWFRKRYKYKMFKLEFYIFLPITLLFYILFFSYTKSSRTFSIKRILQEMKNILE